MTKHPKFSVLIAVYRKEVPSYLSLALNSIWDEQVVKPNEIVIVKDGPLNSELDWVIENFQKKAPVTILSLKKNMGLGVALSSGLNLCSNDIVIRMDSDDISVPNRFSKQVSFFDLHPSISLLSSNIAEFINDPKETVSIREVPREHREIFKFAKTRNPMNHMAVAYRKSAVLETGNYLPFPGYEDYFLWVRMLMKGYKAANIKENLVYARIGNNMIARRQGGRFFKEELRLQTEFKNMGFINRIEWLRNIFLRAIPRLMPIFVLKLIYKTLRK